MTPPHDPLDRLSAARHALVDLGVTIADLHDAEHLERTPTLGEYLP